MQVFLKKINDFLNKNFSPRSTLIFFHGLLPDKCSKTGLKTSEIGHTTYKFQNLEKTEEKVGTYVPIF